MKDRRVNEWTDLHISPTEQKACKPKAKAKSKTEANNRNFTKPKNEPIDTERQDQKSKNMASSSQDEDGQSIDPKKKEQRPDHHDEEARSSNSPALMLALVGPPIKDSLELLESFSASCNDLCFLMIYRILMSNVISTKNLLTSLL